MASDIIGINSVYDSVKETKFSDHLLENNILDEPLYENGEIVKKLFQANNKLSKSLMRIHEETLNPVKEENVYENITFDENRLNTINQIKNFRPILENDVKQNQDEEEDSLKDTLNADNTNEVSPEGNKNLYTSTFSFIIGKPIEPITKNPEEQKELNINIVSSTKYSERNGESEDGTYKSSYAKSLLDSFRKSAPNIQPRSTTEKNPPRQLPKEQEIKTQNELNSIQMTPKVFSPQILDSQIKVLENKISSLTDNILLKDKELEKLRQELMFMKLECNRVKAENRSLKASLNNELSSRSLLFNAEGHPHSPVSSVSSDSDTWTLQQQVSSLNAQLEKAELSRHAYEAATKQLVHFLQTINSTLTTVGGSDGGKMQSPFTPQNTSELLTNLETSLMENRGRTIIQPKIKTNPYFESQRDGSYLVPKTDHRPHLEPERKSSYPLKPESNVGSLSVYKEKENAYITRVDNVSEARDTRSEARDILPQPVLAVCDKKEDAEAVVVNLKDISFMRNKGSAEGKEEGKPKRSSPQRRFSISQKIWNSTKRPLVRSGSVNNLPTELSPFPRVSRAVSTHCVALGKLETLPNNCDEVSEPSSVSPSQRIKSSSKAKDFFSSLKNLFKPEGDRSLENSKKKVSSQTQQKNSKVKNDSPSSSSIPPLNLASPPLSAATSTNPRNRHSTKTQSVASQECLLLETETSSPNSTFYVPFRSSPKEGESRTSSRESREPLSFAKPTPLQEEEEEEEEGVEEELMSGPKEISLTLAKESEPVGLDAPAASPLELQAAKRTHSTSRAPFNAFVIGGGLGASLATTGGDDPKLPGDDFGFERCHRRVHEIQSLELEKNVDVVKEKKLPRRKSCRGAEFVRMEKSPDGGEVVTLLAGEGLVRRKSDFDAVGLKMWKLSRESFRSKTCRVEFV